MVRVETFYPNKIKKTVTIKSNVIECIKDKYMSCYGSDLEECSAEHLKRGFKL